MKFRIASPVGNTRGPVHTESLLRTLHRANLKREPITLSLQCVGGVASIAADFPPALKTLFLQELQDAWPGVRIEFERDVEMESTKQQVTWIADVRKTPDVLSLRCADEFIDQTDNRSFADPMTGLLAAIRTGASGRLQCCIEITVRPASRRRLRQANRILRVLQSRFRLAVFRDVYLDSATHRSCWKRMLATVIAVLGTKRSRSVEEPTSMNAGSVFECCLQVRVTAPADAAQFAKQKLDGIAAAFGRFNNGDMRFRTDRVGRGTGHSRRGQLTTAEELATLWHPLTESGDNAARVQRPLFLELEPPIELSTRRTNANDTILGRVCYRNQKNLVPISMDDLRRHLIVVGKTGCGKSTFLRNVVRQQMERNRGVVLVDPHGQLAEEVAACVPRRRKNDVVYFDASDSKNLPRFNPLTGPAGMDATLIADGVLSSFKNVFGFDSDSAPRLLHIFRNCLLSVIGTQHASMNCVQRMLVDAPFRKSIIAGVENIAVRDFWLTEFQRWNDRDRIQYIASLQNKLGAFTTNQRLNRILNPTKKGIVLRDIMDQSKILVCNLSKGTVGHDASTLLGSLLLSSLQIAAMSRANIPESDRTDCVVVVDEFHSYLAEGNSTMADALAESRKYRTSYVLSTQMLDGQLDSATLAGVLGNCGSTLSMTIGPRDAETLAELLGNGLTATDLMNIPKYHGYLRMLLDGVPHTFSMKTMPPAR